MGVNLVKIWGNWCGPDWTGGQRVAAKDYKGSWDYPAIDDLDRACRRHDKICSGEKGCSKKSDEALIRVALRTAGNPIKRLLNPAKADAADKIILALSLVKPFRKH